MHSVVERCVIIMSKEMVKYRKILYFMLFLSSLLFLFVGYYELKNAIPSQLKVFANKEQKINLNLPVSGELYEETVFASDMGESDIPKDSIHINLQNPITFRAGESGNYKIKCKLLGLIPLKEVDVNVIEDIKITPIGVPIGIYMKTDGILIIGTGTVHGYDGLNYEPAYNLVKSGDYITAINGEKIKDKSDLVSKINLYGMDDIILTIRRNGEEFPLKIKAVETTPGEYKIGIWIRDNTQGVGTLTYISGNKEFGALGHGINDVDTSTLMELDSGTLYETKIISITKGMQGSPGELTGVIDYGSDHILGNITSNTTEGVFGIANDDLLKLVRSEPMEIGLKQDIEIGPAKIMCSLGGEVKTYDIEITEINIATETANKGIVIKVVDPELLEITGGIVQGMSGSPIIQNNKIIGAVTHVFVQDSTKGFGIFIESMFGRNIRQ